MLVLLRRPRISCQTVAIIAVSKFIQDFLNALPPFYKRLDSIMRAHTIAFQANSSASACTYPLAAASDMLTHE